ncbi:hypothetical protein GGR56DRAFT_273356 [Xylariaceae sp. FL0804]|nr:hypothetical protein GGR56DRAFT_273356 [Xylariaceae sp. FL0804]
MTSRYASAKLRLSVRGLSRLILLLTFNAGLSDASISGTPWDIFRHDVVWLAWLVDTLGTSSDPDRPGVVESCPTIPRLPYSRQLSREAGSTWLSSHLLLLFTRRLGQTGRWPGFLCSSGIQDIAQHGKDS